MHAGLNVIADEVVLTEEDWQGWQTELDGLDPHWVRVDGSPSTCWRNGSGSRPDPRLPGHARSQHAVVHVHPTYDAEVDAGLLDSLRRCQRFALHRGWHARDLHR